MDLNAVLILLGFLVLVFYPFIFVTPFIKPFSLKLFFKLFRKVLDFCILKPVTSAYVLLLLLLKGRWAELALSVFLLSLLCIIINKFSLGIISWLFNGQDPIICYILKIIRLDCARVLEEPDIRYAITLFDPFVKTGTVGGESIKAIFLWMGLLNMYLHVWRVLAITMPRSDPETREVLNDEKWLGEIKPVKELCKLVISFFFPACVVPVTIFFRIRVLLTDVLGYSGVGISIVMIVYVMFFLFIFTWDETEF